MKIFFRVDASFQIGTGHLIRCLTLANELKIRGATVGFISQNSESNILKVLIDKGYSLHLLANGPSQNEAYCAHAHWLAGTWQDDANQTALIAKGADWLVVDHYALDERWEKLVKKNVSKIAVIDDLADRQHQSDLLLDQNYYRDAFTRYDGLALRDCVLLLTPKYSLLRKEFQVARKSLKARRESVKKVLIFFGGVDADNNTAKALDALKGFAGQIKVIAGAANQNLAELEKFCRAESNFTLLPTVNNMAELMVEADIAIGSGGSTTWERACLGLPSFVWPIADNQMAVLLDMDAFGAVKLTSPKKLIADIEAADLETMSAQALELTDGKGAGRVANYISYDLREAKTLDCRRIWEIRNEGLVRENSINSEIIPFEAHKKWFEAALRNDNRHILVLVDKRDIAGVLRFDVFGDEGLAAEISIYLNPEYFNLNLGENLLERSLAHIRQSMPNLKRLTAQILDNNLKSQKLFTRFGFNKIEGMWLKNYE